MLEVQGNFGEVNPPVDSGPANWAKEWKKEREKGEGGGKFIITFPDGSVGEAQSREEMIRLLQDYREAAD